MIKKELDQLKLMITKENPQKSKTKIKGLWKGVEITGLDIEDAKKSLNKFHDL